MRPERSIRDLHSFHKLPLADKVDAAKQRISEFYTAQRGGVYVAYSGGKDSEVLLHLVRSVYPDVKAVFLNTGLEWPEVVAYVRGHENVVWLKPDMTYPRVLREYGYPVISKRVAQAVRKYHDTKNLTTRNMLLGGCGVSKFSIPKMYRYLLGIPYRISEQCCLPMKKEPMRRYAHENGEAPYIGTLADESKARADDWQMHGCNITEGHKRQSRPLMMWNQEAIYEYARREGIKFASVYRYVERTSCMFCGFGIHGPEGLQKYAAIKLLHPKIYNACMDKLGMRAVLEAVGHDVDKEVDAWIPRLLDRAKNHPYLDCYEEYTDETAK